MLVDWTLERCQNRPGIWLVPNPNPAANTRLKYRVYCSTGLHRVARINPVFGAWRTRIRLRTRVGNAGFVSAADLRAAPTQDESSMRTYAILSAVLCTAAAVASGAPLDPKQVSEQATWLVHLDVDAMRESRVVQQAYGKYLELNPEAEKQLAKLRQQFGFELKKDLHGITLYGSRLAKLGKDDGVLLIHADLNRSTAESLVRLGADYRASAYQGYELHRWTESKDKPDAHVMFGTFCKSDLVLIGSSEREVKAALDVLDGRTASLAGTAAPLAAALPEGAVVVARARGLAEAELPFKSPLVTQSETFSLVVGERNGESFAEARLLTKSPQTAEQVKAIVEGLRAMGELQRSSDQGFVRLLGKLKANVNDKAVDVEWRAAADEVWTQLLKEMKPQAKVPKR